MENDPAPATSTGSTSDATVTNSAATSAAATSTDPVSFRFRQYSQESLGVLMSSYSQESEKRLDVLFTDLVPKFCTAMDKRIVNDGDEAKAMAGKKLAIAAFLRIFRVKRTCSLFQAEAYRYIAITEIARNTCVAAIWAKLVKAVFGIEPAAIRNFLAHADVDCTNRRVIASDELKKGWKEEDVANAFSECFAFLLPINAPRNDPRLGDFTLGFQLCCAVFTALFNQYCFSLSPAPGGTKMFGLYPIRMDSDTFYITVDGEELACKI